MLQNIGIILPSQNSGKSSRRAVSNGSKPQTRYKWIEDYTYTETDGIGSCYLKTAINSHWLSTDKQNQGTNTSVGVMAINTLALTLEDNIVDTRYLVQPYKRPIAVSTKLGTYNGQDVYSNEIRTVNYNGRVYCTNVVLTKPDNPVYQFLPIENVQVPPVYNQNITISSRSSTPSPGSVNFRTITVNYPIRCVADIDYTVTYKNTYIERWLRYTYPSATDEEINTMMLEWDTWRIIPAGVSVPFLYSIYFYVLLDDTTVGSLYYVLY